MFNILEMAEEEGQRGREEETEGGSREGGRKEGERTLNSGLAHSRSFFFCVPFHGNERLHTVHP